MLVLDPEHPLARCVRRGQGQGRGTDSTVIRTSVYREKVQKSVPRTEPCTEISPIADVGYSAPPKYTVRYTSYYYEY